MKAKHIYKVFKIEEQLEEFEVFGSNNNIETYCTVQTILPVGFS